MVNIGEPLLNVVTLNKPKVLRVSTRGQRLGPKGKEPGIGGCKSPIVDEALSAERRNLTHQNQVLSRNVVSPSASLWESKPRGVPMGWWVKDGGRSEGRPVTGRIGVAPVGNITPRESGLTS